MLLIAGSASAGAVLGLRCRVFMLAPVILVGALAICAISQQPLWQVCMTIATFAVLLQLSYVGGALLRFAISGGANLPASWAALDLPELGRSRPLQRRRPALLVLTVIRLKPVETALHRRL